MQIDGSHTVELHCVRVRPGVKANVIAYVFDVDDNVVESQTILIRNGSSLELQKVTPTPAAIPYLSLVSKSTPSGLDGFLDLLADPVASSSSDLEAALRTLGLYPA